MAKNGEIIIIIIGKIVCHIHVISTGYVLFHALVEDAARARLTRGGLRQTVPVKFV